MSYNLGTRKTTTTTTTTTQNVYTGLEGEGNESLSQTPHISYSGQVLVLLLTNCLNWDLKQMGMAMPTLGGNKNVFFVILIFILSIYICLYSVAILLKFH